MNDYDIVREVLSKRVGDHYSFPVAAQEALSRIEAQAKGHYACERNMDAEIERLRTRLERYERSLRAIEKGRDWGSNGFDVDGDYRLSRQAMRREARRALSEPSQGGDGD